MQPISRSLKDLASVGFSRSGAIAMATICGEIDMSNAAAVLAQLVASTDGTAYTLLVVELSGLTFLGSDGIRVLVQFKQHLKERGCEMMVSHPTPIVRKVFEVTGLAVEFSLSPSQSGTDIVHFG